MFTSLFSGRKRKLAKDIDDENNPYNSDNNRNEINRRPPKRVLRFSGESTKNSGKLSSNAKNAKHVHPVKHKTRPSSSFLNANANSLRRLVAEREETRIMKQIRDKYGLTSNASNDNARMLIVRNRLKHVLSDMNASDIDLRLKRYQTAKSYMSNMPNCLVKKKFEIKGNKKVRIIDPRTKKVKTKVFLGASVASDDVLDMKRNKDDAIIDFTHRIGTNSAYGAIWHTKGASLGIQNRLIRFATKVMEDIPENAKEVEIMRTVSRYVERREFVNFPLLFASKLCDKPLCKKNEKDCPSQYLDGTYHLVMAELANGDLKHWLHDSLRTLKEYTSGMFQIFMALAKFNDIGYKHNDLHWGNALYHNVKPGGYWWFNVHKTDFFVENTGQLWVLWDFGLSESIDKSTLKPGHVLTNDFYNIVHAFFDDKGPDRPLGWMGTETDMPYIDYPIELKRIGRKLASTWKQQLKTDVSFDFSNFFVSLLTYIHASVLKPDDIGIKVKGVALDQRINKQPFVISLSPHIQTSRRSHMFNIVSV